MIGGLGLLALGLGVRVARRLIPAVDRLALELEAAIDVDVDALDAIVAEEERAQELAATLRDLCQDLVNGRPCGACLTCQLREVAV